MLKVPETDVAVVAKQATDAVGLVAVVNMEGALSFRIGCLANSALSSLGRKHPVILASRKVVVFLAMVVLVSFGKLFSALCLLCSDVGKVVQAPSIVAFVTARLAVHPISVFGSARLSKFGKRLGFPTLRAAFETGRQVESASWHRSNHTSNLLLAQGAV
jgi:hypothetical protein